MSEWREIRLNNFLFNAGVVGFVYMLEKCNISKELYQIDESELHIAPELFIDEQYDLSRLYFQALRSRFEEDTAWKQLKDLEGEITSLDLSIEEEQNKFCQIINDGTEKPKKFRKFKRLEDSSYIAGYEIVKQHPYNNTFDALTEWRNLKKEKDLEVQKEKLLEILQYIIKYPEVFCYKDIAYSRINKILNGDPKVFLYTRYRTKNMIQAYHDEFVSPLREYLNEPKKGENQCIECGAWIKKDEQGLVWLQMGVDFKRKKSYFWDFLPDSFLCPICRLIYSYAPLGFIFAVGKSSDAVFINNNSSIKSLRQDNMGLARAKIEESENFNSVCHRLTMNLLQQEELELKERELDNIQVIIQHNGKFDINIISKHKLNVLKNCRNSFEILSKLYDIEIRKKEFCNVYNEVLHNLLNSINNYYLINNILRLEKNYTWFLDSVLKIQIYSKGGDRMNENYKPDAEYRRAQAMSYCGAEIRLAVSHDREEAEHKLRGTVYQLLNALQVKDRKRFMDVSLRLYTGLGQEIPGLFLRMFEDDETFLNLGYAFLLGLKGEEKPKSQNDSELKEANQK